MALAKRSARSFGSIAESLGQPAPEFQCRDHIREGNERLPRTHILEAASRRETADVAFRIDGPLLDEFFQPGDRSRTRGLYEKTLRRGDELLRLERLLVAHRDRDSPGLDDRRQRDMRVEDHVIRDGAADRPG